MRILINKTSGYKGWQTAKIQQAAHKVKTALELNPMLT